MGNPMRTSRFTLKWILFINLTFHYSAWAGNHNPRETSLWEAVERVWILPSSARLEGAQNAFWMTDLTLANYGNTEASLVLKFLGNNQDGRFGPEQTLQLAGGETRICRDVLQSVFGLVRGYGAIRLSSASPLIAVHAEYYTHGETGS
jgi:hypothetical protein